MDKMLIIDSWIQSLVLLPKQKQKINHSSSREIKKQTMRMEVLSPMLDYIFLKGRDHDSCTLVSPVAWSSMPDTKQLLSKYLLTWEELNHSLSLKMALASHGYYLEINAASSHISTKPVCKNCWSMFTHSIYLPGGGLVIPHGRLRNSHRHILF